MRRPRLRPEADSGVHLLGRSELLDRVVTHARRQIERPMDWPDCPACELTIAPGPWRLMKRVR